MNIIKLLIVSALCYVAVILQNTFLPYISIMGAVPNLVFVIFFTTLFFEEKNNATEMFALAIITGFFLDVFSSSYFGICIMALMLVWGLHRFANYFLKENRQIQLVVYYIALFFASFIVYYSINFIAGIQTVTLSQLGVVFLYSVPLALIAFYIYRIFFRSIGMESQLKLFV